MLLILLSTSFLLSCNFIDISIWCCLISDICSSKLSYTPLIKLLNLLFIVWILCCVSSLREIMSCDRLLVYNSNLSNLSRISEILLDKLFSRFCLNSPSPPLTLLNSKLFTSPLLITAISLSTLLAVASSVSSNALRLLSDRVVILTLTSFYDVLYPYGVSVETCSLICRLPFRGSVGTLLLL